MHVYKELSQPTTVTHAVSCRFMCEDEPCLVVVRGNSLLEVYELITVVNSELKKPKKPESPIVDGEDSFIGTDLNIQPAREETTTKLRLKGQWPLDGFVTDIRPIQTLATEDDRDCLLIAFKYAKMSLINWNSMGDTIATISLHYYERDLLEAHFVDQTFEAYFRVDPQNSCACMMYQRDQFAFLPFYQKDALAAESADYTDKVYEPSYLIHSTRLDENLTNIVDYTFLHEYREPTMAILYEPTRTWTGLLPRHKDSLQYMVLSLDLQQHSSTAIISVADLPHDINQVIPLKAPLNGSLLVGPNMLIHVDSSGKITAVSVNKLASHTTKQPLQDQSDMELKLEGSRVVQLDNTKGELLMVLSTGELYGIHFKIEGRRIYGFRVSRHKNDTQDWIPRPCCAVMAKPGHVFVGSRGGDSRLLSWYSENATTGTDKVAVAEDTDELDAIYGDDDADNEDVKSTSAEVMRFSACDNLANYGPIVSMAVGKPRVPAAARLAHTDPRQSGYDLVAATGVGVAGSLSVFQKSVRPYVYCELKLHTAESIWSLSTRKSATAGEVLFDNFIVTSADEDEAGNASTLYKVENMQLVNVTNSSAFHRQATVGIGTVGNGTAAVQVLVDTATIYDAEFKTAGKKVKLGNRALSVSFQDPYVLITLESGECTLVQSSTTKTGKPTLDVVKQTPKDLKCGSLLRSEIFQQMCQNSDHSKKRKRGSSLDGEDEDSEDSGPPPVAAACLTQDNQLKVYNISDQNQSVEFSGLSRLPTVLHQNADLIDISAQTQEAEVLQVVFAKIGDSVSCDEYLAILTADNGVYLYKAYAFHGKLRFVKEQNLNLVAQLRNEEGVDMVPVQFGGYCCIYITGSNPQVIFKSHKSPLRVHRFGPLSEGLVGVSSFNTDAIDQGIIYVNEMGVVRIAGIDSSVDFTGSRWPVKRVNFGTNVTCVCYHERSQVYAISTCGPIPYDYVDEDGAPVQGLLEDVPRGESFKSKLKLISPITWTVIGEAEMNDNEVILALKSVKLVLNEKTQRKKEVFAFGTSFLRGEDLAAKGNFYVYDAVDIVPEPGRPETHCKLKFLSQEEVKGAVTSVCEVNGYLSVAQGQKLVVRSLQEDNSIIPVAFLDMNVYINDSKSCKNFMVVSDSVWSAWVVGFGHEPYRMNCMGKDLRRLETLSSEFIVSNGQLFALVSDAKRALHILEYNPSDAASVGGQKLLMKGDFYTGRRYSTMIKLPTLDISKEYVPEELVPICGSDEGVLSTVVPLHDERQYRAFSVLQQQITDRDEHNACLNPRMHSEMALDFSQSSEGIPSQRAVIDYNVVRRFPSLNVEKRYQFGRKTSKNPEEVLDYFKDLEVVLDFM